MESHPYGWLSLVPSLVAIVLAIATRHVVLSMLLGVCAGAVITSGGNLVRAIQDICELHLWHSLVQEERLRVFVFTVLMGAMVGVIERSGGMAGLVRVVSRWAHNRCRGQIATWFLGLLVFFDDYANTVLLGNTLQPLCARLKISKEKLAYIVDSTAAPVAGLAVISTWVAGEIDFIRNGLESISTPHEVSAFQLFIQSIPYRFYVIWSLVFVFLVAWLQRDFGPMLKAERAIIDGAPPTSDDPEAASTTQASAWWNAIIPILTTVAAVLWLLLETGRPAAGAESSDSGKTVSLVEVFGAADTYLALVWGSAIGLLMAVLLALSQRLLSWRETQQAMGTGARLMLPALAVLWLASTLSAMAGNDALDSQSMRAVEGAYPAQEYRLYTGEFLAGLIAGEPGNGANQADLSVWMPTIVFLLSAAISFSTGTSWGTMAIVMPVAIPLAYGTLVGGPDGSWAAHPVMIGTIGSVLAGSIFGDHCSPISDTTVLSSQACGCDHSAHVWTQLPYAMAVALVTIICGTIPAGFGGSLWLLQPLGVVLMFVILLVIGRRTADAGR